MGIKKSPNCYDVIYNHQRIGSLMHEDHPQVNSIFTTKSYEWWGNHVCLSLKISLLPGGWEQQQQQDPFLIKVPLFFELFTLFSLSFDDAELVTECQYWYSNRAELPWICLANFLMSTASS